MRKTLAIVAATAALTFTGVASANASTNAAPATRATANDTTQNNNHSDETGLWGLLGLLGLGGLARRKETADHSASGNTSRR